MSHKVVTVHHNPACLDPDAGRGVITPKDLEKILNDGDWEITEMFVSEIPMHQTYTRAAEGRGAARLTADAVILVLKEKEL